MDSCLKIIRESMPLLRRKSISPECRIRVMTRRSFPEPLMDKKGFFISIEMESNRQVNRS